MDFPPPHPPDEPHPPEGPPAAAAPSEPVWSGIDVILVVLVTALAMLAALIVGAVAWAVVARVAGEGLASAAPLQSVAFLLLVQTAAFATGFGFAAGWIRRVHGQPFWRSLHWTAIPLPVAGAALAAGAAVSLAVSELGRVLPIPKQLPIDQIFSPHTAWLLAGYGVAVAPFFEEFFFRGLIFPSLEAGFREGLQPDELPPWRAFTRVLASLAALTAGYWLLRAHLLHLPPSATLLAWLLAALVAVALPAIPVELANAGLRAVGRWQPPRTAAIAVTGILFGLAHGVQLGYAWAAVLLLSAVGILLTWVRARTGSVLASWCFHCAYNFCLFVALYISTGGFRDFSQMT